MRRTSAPSPVPGVEVVTTVEDLVRDARPRGPRRPVHTGHPGPGRRRVPRRHGARGPPRQRRPGRPDRRGGARRSARLGAPGAGVRRRAARSSRSPPATGSTSTPGCASAPTCRGAGPGSGRRSRRTFVANLDRWRARRTSRRRRRSRGGLLMIVDYDPLSDEAMVDPQRLYAQLREHDPVHHMAALRRVGAGQLREPSGRRAATPRAFSVRRGQTPNQVLLGEPAANLTFPELDPPEHRLRRRVLSPFYTREAARLDEPAVRSIARQVLEPLLDRGRLRRLRGLRRPGDLTRRLPQGRGARSGRRPGAVAGCVGRWSASPASGAAHRRTSRPWARCSGTSRSSSAPAGTTRSRAGGLLAELLDARIDGEALDDAQIAAELHTLLVTGSETTELAAAGALYHLEQNPDAEGRGPRRPHARRRRLRRGGPLRPPDRHPLPGRPARHRGLRSAAPREGQGVLLLWGSANRDEREYPDADRFDIHRRYERSLLFGHGQHKCIGEHLGMRMGAIILEELLRLDRRLRGGRRGLPPSPRRVPQGLRPGARDRPTPIEGPARADPVTAPRRGAARRPASPRRRCSRSRCSGRRCPRAPRGSAPRPARRPRPAAPSWS